MNRKTVLSSAIALMMIAGQPAFAQGNSDHNRHDRDNRSDRDNRHDRDNQEWKRQGRHDNRDWGRSHNEQRSRGRGAGPNHEYYRGDRLPAEYRHRNYVVDDWRGHRLSAPPRGYHWVQSGNDYILVAI